jgi:hypothetical protein
MKLGPLSKIKMSRTSLFLIAWLGMVLLEHALITLYRDGAINRENLFAYCNDPAEEKPPANRYSQSRIYHNQ